MRKEMCYEGGIEPGQKPFLGNFKLYSYREILTPAWKNETKDSIIAVRGERKRDFCEAP